MKLNKRVISMFAVGILATGFSFAAASEIKGVIESRYAIKLNEEEAVLPSDLKVLNYNNATYVPLRFLSENLGVEVNFIQDNGMIILNNSRNEEKLKSRIEELESKVVELQRENMDLQNKLDFAENRIYGKFPTSITDGYNMNFRISRMDQSSNQATFYISIANNDSLRTISLDPYESILEINGEKYTNSYVETDNIMNTIGKDKVENGILVFNDVDQKIEKAKLTLKYRINNSVSESITIYFENAY